MAESSSAGAVTTTGHAILGVLAIEPRSAYELAQEMRHCFEFFWPRADVRVYAEAKGLVGLGLVTARVEFSGRRRRTIYSITPRGRAALRRWLRDPPKPIALEFEALVKVFLAAIGNREDLVRTLSKTLEDARYMLEVATNVRNVYLARCAPHQDEYVQVWQFVYDFLTDYFALVHDWSARTLGAVSSWGDLRADGKREQALRTFEDKEPAVRLGGAGASAAAMPGTWQEGRTRPRRVVSAASR